MIGMLETSNSSHIGDCTRYRRSHCEKRVPNFNSKSQYTVWDLLLNLCHISCDSYSVFLVIAGISTLAAYMGGADQFHSIGWYNVAIGGALLFLLIALFRGECEWKKPEMNCTTTNCSSIKSNKTQALTGSVVTYTHY